MTGRLLLRLIAFYQRAVSPALPPRCRFYPTCSAYAAEAVTRHGAARGSWLTLRRLVKCAPWHPGGVDLVPEPRPARDAATGTGAPGHSSCSAPASHPRGDRRPDRATPPASRRAPEESSVA